MGSRNILSIYHSLYFRSQSSSCSGNLEPFIRRKVPARRIRPLYLVPELLRGLRVELFVADEPSQWLFFLRDEITSLHELAKFEVYVEVVGIFHYLCLFRSALLVFLKDLLEIGKGSACKLILRRARVIRLRIVLVDVRGVRGARFGKVVDKRHLDELLLVFHSFLPPNEKCEENDAERVFKRGGKIRREVLYPRARDVAKRAYLVEEFEVAPLHGGQYSRLSFCPFRRFKQADDLFVFDLRKVLVTLADRTERGRRLEADDFIGISSEQLDGIRRADRRGEDELRV